MDILTALEWDTWLIQFPEAHILQTAGWGELKSHFGWKPYHIKEGNCGALVLFRTLPFGFKIGYIPKGPVGAGWEQLWPGLDKICRQEKAIFVKVEPDLWDTQTNPDVESLKKFASQPANTIQPSRTIVVSLSGGEQDWMSRMKQKTRYNIRLAGKKDVRIQTSTDIAAFSRLMQETGERDGFGVHSEGYYSQAYQLFAQKQECELFLATYQDQILAGLMAHRRGDRSWFMFGGTSNKERNRMPAYLIQWEAMRWAAANGCAEYDLWGAPDYDEEVLERDFQGRADGLWGVYRFKRGFGGEVRRFLGAWDKIYYKNIYWAYKWYLRRRKSMIQ